MMYLVANILTHCGYDVNKLDIKVTLNEPVQISADVISKYSDIADLLKSFKEVNPQMTPTNQFQLLIKLGMPVDIANLICRNTSTFDIDSAEDLGKFLKDQKIVNAPGATAAADDIEESIVKNTVRDTLTSKVFLAENYYLALKLNQFAEENRKNTDRSLKESLLSSKKKPLTEDGKQN